MWNVGVSVCHSMFRAQRNVEKHLMKSSQVLPRKFKCPWSVNYQPEVGITPEVPPQEAAYYQSLIGILRWIVELRRADICMEVSAMTSMMTAP